MPIRPTAQDTAPVSLMFPPPMEFDVSVIRTMVGTHALQDWVSCHSLTHCTPFKSIWVNCHSLTHFTPFKSIRVTLWQLGKDMTGFGWEHDRLWTWAWQILSWNMRDWMGTWQTFDPQDRMTDFGWEHERLDGSMTSFGWEHEQLWMGVWQTRQEHDRLSMQIWQAGPGTSQTLDDIRCRLEQSTYFSMDYYRR